MDGHMKTLTIKGIPEPLYRELKRQAKASRRSLNSEAIVCLETVALAGRVPAADVLARVAAVRERARGPHLRDAELRAAKNAGRP
jgi:plasmid stability protein